MTAIISHSTSNGARRSGVGKVCRAGRECGSGKQLQPVFIEHRPVRDIFQPYIQLDDVFRRRAPSLQYFSHIGERLLALRLHSLGDFARGRILSKDSAADQKRTQPGWHSE